MRAACICFGGSIDRSLAIPAHSYAHAIVVSASLSLSLSLSFSFIVLFVVDTRVYNRTFWRPSPRGLSRVRREHLAHRVRFPLARSSYYLLQTRFHAKRELNHNTPTLQSPSIHKRKRERNNRAQPETRAPDFSTHSLVVHVSVSSLPLPLSRARTSHHALPPVPPSIDRTISFTYSLRNPTPSKRAKATHYTGGGRWCTQRSCSRCSRCLTRLSLLPTPSTV